MSPGRYVHVPMRYKLWRRRHLRLIAADLLAPCRQAEHAHRDHLAATIEWLERAQDVRDGEDDAGGVSAGWSFEDGWLPSYPETSGYIIETLIAAATVLDRPELLRRALRIIDWELSIQHDDGAFPGHFGEAGSHPVIFNTGQIMHGMLAGYVHFDRKECLESAIRAGAWLARHQDDDGCWRVYEHNGVPHTYNTRASWALLSTAIVAGDATLKQAAIRNLNWAMEQQTNSGWFMNNAFVPGHSPFTHTIAYAIRGMMESGLLLGEEQYIQGALKTANAMAKVQRHDGWLAGSYNDGWVATATYACLTGIAQMSINWMRLAQDGGVPELRNAAQRAITFLKKNHRLNDQDEVVKGGIAGSTPIWGAYSRFEYPNWAAKFFADALMMDMDNIVIPQRPARPGAD